MKRATQVSLIPIGDVAQNLSEAVPVVKTTRRAGEPEAEMAGGTAEPVEEFQAASVWFEETDGSVSISGYA